MRFYLNIPGLKKKKDKPPFKVGDLVNLDRRYASSPEEAKVVRKIIGIEKDEKAGASGYMVTAEAFKCAHCGRPYGETIEHVDSINFVPVDKNDFMNQMLKAIHDGGGDKV